MTRRRAALLRLAFLLASTLLGLAAAELLARRIYPEEFLSLVDPVEDHPYRPFASARQTWGTATYTICTNSLGFKDRCPGREVAKDPAPRKRVVFLGDSFTEGVGFPQERTFSGFAEAALNRDGGGFEALNGGRVSYSPLLESQRLARFFAAGYRADAVVLLPDLSDLQDEIDYSSRYEISATGEPLRFRGAQYDPLRVAVYNHSALARGIKRRSERGLASGGDSDPRAVEEERTRLARATAPLSARDLLAASGPGRHLLRPNWIFHRPSLDGWVKDGFRSLEGNLVRAKRIAEENGARFLVVIYPWPQMLYTREDPARYQILAARFPEPFANRELIRGRLPTDVPSEYQTRMRELCRRHGIPLLDLVPDFQAAERSEELFIPGDVHFTEAGNRLAGARIAAAVRVLLARAPVDDERTPSRRIGNAHGQLVGGREPAGAGHAFEQRSGVIGPQAEVLGAERPEKLLL
jgi:lysophospholipase L1-like esterase